VLSVAGVAIRHALHTPDSASAGPAATA
jgi:hypothetical protein